MLLFLAILPWGKNIYEKSDLPFLEMGRWSAEGGQEGRG